jgi:hypothetical protein
MQPEFQTISGSPVSRGLLLLTCPRKFFTGPAPGAAATWRTLLLAGLLSALPGGFSFKPAAAVVGTMVLFTNAVGMTCIFSGCVFAVLRFGREGRLSAGRVFTVCAWASLGPILISWVPGSPWVAEPWRWWVTVIGLSAAGPCSRRRAACTVGGAVVMMYGLFWVVLSNM